MSAGAIIGLATVSGLAWSVAVLAFVAIWHGGSRSPWLGLAFLGTILAGAGSCSASVAGAVTAGQECGR